MDIKILVATHKKYWMPEDEVYLPLHVGAEGKADLGYTKDNTGDNISAKNPNFCELTGMYWAWKNLSCEYIGLCHYRRYFAHVPKSSNLTDKKKAIFSKVDYEKLLQTCDVILPQKRNYYIETVRSHYEHAHHKSDLDEVEKIIAEKFPAYSETFDKVMSRTKLHILNMFVMKKALFDEYCQWLFPVEFALEKKIDVSYYDPYNSRVFGFLSERLFNVWLEKRNLKIAEVNVVNLEPVNWPQKVGKFLKRKFSN